MIGPLANPVRGYSRLRPERLFLARRSSTECGIALGIIVLTLCGFNATGRAGIIVAGTEQAHIDFAADPVFQSVGSVAGWDGAVWRMVGTGVLVDKQWVMLTGHQLTTAGYSTYRFSLGHDLFQPNTGRSVADAYYVNGTSGGNLFSPDFALLHLADPITTATPATVYGGNSLRPGTRVVFSGFGRLGYFPAGELPFDGLQRAGENIVTQVGPTSGMSGDRFGWDYGPAYRTASLPLEMNGSSFDSGSGTFAFIDDKWQLVGILAQVAPLTDTFAIRPAAYADWTTQIMHVPEPSNIVLTLTGAGLFFLVQRYSKRHNRYAGGFM